MTAIIISGIAISIFLVSLLLTKKKKLYADRFLIAYFVYFILSQAYTYFEKLGYFEHSPWMLMAKGVYLLSGPLFFYYVYTLTTSRLVSTPLYLATLLPFVSYVVHFLFYYCSDFDWSRMNVANGVPSIDGELTVGWTLFIVLLLISDPVYLIWFYALLKKYKQQIGQSLSNTERVNLNWLQTLFLMWAISAVVLLPVLILSVGQNWFEYPIISIVLELSYVIFVFLLGYFGFRQTSLFANADSTSKSESKSPSYDRSGLSEDHASLYHSRLLVCMQTEKPYLNGELTAQELADQQNISANHLSQVLSQKQGHNFFDFINTYRVEEVKRKMSDPKFGNLTLLAIALESGFNSKTSFNTVFKKMTGQTPSQYFKSLK